MALARGNLISILYTKLNILQGLAHGRYSPATEHKTNERPPSQFDPALLLIVRSICSTCVFSFAGLFYSFLGCISVSSPGAVLLCPPPHMAHCIVRHVPFLPML